jgi:hypothetical protein
VQLDLHKASYEDFVTYVFAHPVADVDDVWYFGSRPDIRVEPKTVISYLTRLLTSADRLIPLFTIPQITQGIEFLFGYGSEWFSGELWNGMVPWPTRRACILSIPELYPAIFEKYDSGGLGFMLWDTIAFGYDSGSRDPAANAEDARVQVAMFEALTGMLQSENAETQAAAIHGLGHLRHVKSHHAIQDHLQSGRADPDVRSYAEEVLAGRFR